MADISAKLVMELRNKTGAGMSDCKKALVENDGDMEKSIDYLRKKGAASAAKRSDRDTNEGLIVTRVSADGKTAVLLSVTCETDFVARNQDFVDYVNNVADALISSTATTADELMSVSVNGTTVEALHNGILAKFSERIGIYKIERVNSNGSVVSYIHNGSKLAVLLDLNVELNEANSLIAKDIAMQVAAMNPQFVDRSFVTQDVLDKEKEIYVDQAIAEGKKPEIAERVAQGRVEKFYKESCLIEQAFVKDGSKTVSDVLKEIDANAKINNFYRVSIG